MSELPPIEELAGKGSLLAVLMATAWKIWLRLKRDHREDKADKRELESGDHIVESYDSILTQLRGEVTRLAKTVSEMSEALDHERRARHRAEHRIAALEAQLVALGHLPVRADDEQGE